MFNGDDPMNINTDTLEKAKIFDLVLTSCEGSVSKYKIYSGVKNVLYNVHGYNPSYFYPLEDESDEVDNFKCDISLVCFNLFTDNFYKDQYIKRTDMINQLVKYSEEKGRIFKLFGPPMLKEYYPSNYECDVEYYRMNLLFNSSKINICTHPLQSKNLYISDMEMRILGSGGLLFIDKIKGIENFLSNGENCVLIDKNDYVNQIDNILNNYDDYQKIRKNGHEFSKNFTWDNWVKNIHTEISKRYFCPEVYKEVYDVSEDDPEALWNHFINEGMDKKNICYDVEVPKKFRSKEYKEHFDLKNENKKYLWIHWNINGKSKDFLQDKFNNKMVVDSEKMNLSTDQWFELNHAFNKVIIPSTNNKGLLKVSKICKNNPRLDINEALEIYFGFCE